MRNGSLFWYKGVPYGYPLALIIKKDGQVSEELVQIPQVRKSCSFERIYFSRGSDKAIYKERKQLDRVPD